MIFFVQIPFFDIFGPHTSLDILPCAAAYNMNVPSLVCGRITATLIPLDSYNTYTYARAKYLHDTADKLDSIFTFNFITILQSTVNESIIADKVQVSAIDKVWWHALNYPNIQVIFLAFHRRPHPMYQCCWSSQESRSGQFSENNEIWLNWNWTSE